MGRRSGTAAGLAVFLALAADAATAQQVLPLPGGFSPDPWLAEFEAAGDLAAGDWVKGCPGYVAEAPALRIVLSEAEAPLRLVQIGEGLAGLVAAGPDGIYRCAAQGASGRTMLVLDPALDGDWTVFPALASAGGSASVRLLISERDLDDAELFRLSGVDAGPLLPEAPPAFGLHVLPSDGPLTVPVAVAGTVPAGTVVDPSCAGWIDPSRPDLVVRLETEEPVLAIGATGGADLTLVVVDPAGGVSCNDDAYGTDPALGFEPALPGDWAVWVGSFSSGGGESALVTVDRVPAGSSAAPQDLALDAPPAGGTIGLGAAGEALSLSVDPTASASDIDPGCTGNIDPSRPDAAVSVPEGSAALWLRVAAGSDSTLLVVGPDRALHCIDDGFGVDPVLRFDQPEAGDWLVWVGLWSGSGPEPVTLHVGPDAASVDLPEGFDPGAGTMPEPVESPFLGRDIPDALTALDILLEEPSMAGALRYERREALGTEGFRLHGVELHDPAGGAPPIRIAQVTVDALDLSGLSAAGAPGRFRLTVSGLSYSDAATAAADSQGLSLPDLDPDATLALDLALLPPDGDTTRRDLSFGLHVEGQIGVRFTARVRWPETDGLPPDTGTLPAEAMELEIENRGYVARMLALQAAEMGMTRADLVAMTLDSLGNALAPVIPGSPAERLIGVLGRALETPEGPGILRLGIGTEDPLGLDALLDTLAQQGAAAAEAAGLTIGIDYEPLP